MRAFCRFWLVLSLGVSFLVSPWNLQSANAGVTKVNCSESGSIIIANNAVIAPAVDEYGDTQDCQGAVTIPAGVLSIPNSIFENNSYLTTVNIPASVNSIGNTAFSGTEWLSSINVTEPNATYTSVNGILFNNDKTSLIAFPSGKRLETYTVPASVTTISNYAFYMNNYLYSIALPANVSDIEAGAFRGKPLEEITVAEQNDNFTSVDGVLFNKDESSLISYPAGKTETYYAIPYGITTIGDFAFNRQRFLRGADIPTTVTSIGVSAFYEAEEMYYIDFDAGSELVSIADSAFESVWWLNSMEIPDSVKTIGNRAFMGTRLSSVDIPSGLESIGAGAFSSMRDLENITVTEPNSNYESLNGVLFDESMSTLMVYPENRGRAFYTIPSGVTSISSNAFFRDSSPFDTGTNLQFLTIPSSVTSIGNSAFVNDALEEVIFESGIQLETIGEGVFARTNISTIAIPASVTSIGSSAFEASNLQRVTFESGSQLETIGASAFKDTEISTITIPASVTSIGNSAFYQYYRYNKLTSVTFESGSQLETIGASAFEYAQIPTITIPSSVTSIGSSAFSETDELKSIKFASGSQLVTIGRSAFYLSSITTITIPSTVKSIGDEAFSESRSLTAVLFSPGIQLSTIGYRVFADTALDWFSVPASVTSIGSEAFAGADLGTFTVPAGVTSIGSKAFAETGLTSLKFETGSKLTSIGSSAFSDTTLSTIVIPAGVKSIGTLAFASYYFQSIYFLGNAPTVPGNLVEDVYVPGIPKAYVKSGSTGFSKIGKQWKGVTVTAMPTTAIVKPSVSGAAKVSQTLAAKSGEWIGYTTPKLSYQWYSCTAQVKSVTGTIPKTCKTISKATKSTLAITKTSKGKYLAVLVTGKGTGTTAIKWLSKSTAKVS